MLWWYCMFWWCEWDSIVCRVNAQPRRLTRFCDLTAKLHCENSNRTNTITLEFIRFVFALRLTHAARLFSCPRSVSGIDAIRHPEFWGEPPLLSVELFCKQWQREGGIWRKVHKTQTSLDFILICLLTVYQPHFLFISCFLQILYIFKWASDV